MSSYCYIASICPSGRQVIKTTWNALPCEVVTSKTANSFKNSVGSEDTIV